MDRGKIEMDLDDVSITIPAFNEEKRLGAFLEELIAYAEKSQGQYEIIVVDDGSTDRTSDLARRYQERYERLRLLSIRKNQGKGEAVRRGMLHSQKPVRVFMDADGSFGPKELERLFSHIRDGQDIVIANRFVPESVTDYREGVSRKIMRYVFNALVRCILFDGIRDVQCGFKMFRGEVANRLLPQTKIKGFGLDLEVLYLAKRMHFGVQSVPVCYVHREGSSVRVWRDTLKLFVNIFQIRWWHKRR